MRWLGTLVLGATLLAHAAGAETALRFCYDPYPPYAIQEDGQRVSGMKVNVLQEVVALIEGVEATVTLMPWQRCQEAARTGSIDGILPLFPNAARASYLAFSDPVFAEQAVFFYAASRFPEGLAWTGNAEELSHLRLGMLRGGYIDATMQDSFEQHGTLQQGSSIEALMLMLVNGRVDLVGTDLNVGRYVAGQQGVADQVVAITRPIVEQTSHFGLSRVSGADAHLSAFNAALATLRHSGRLDALLADVP